MRIITTLNELKEYVDETQRDVTIEVSRQDNGQIDYMHFSGHDNAEHIYVINKHEYEHINEFDVEININYSKEYTYKSLNLRSVLMLLYMIKLIK